MIGTQLVDPLSLYRGKDYSVSKHIVIKQPTLDDIYNFGEHKYFNTVSLLCSTTTDLRLELYDNFNIWWDEIDDFELFVMGYNSFDDDDISLIFGTDFSLKRMTPIYDSTSQEKKLYDETTGAVIDRFIYEIIVTYLRKCHGIKKNFEKGGNKMTKRMLIEEDRNERILAQQNKKEDKSILLPLISAMTNHPNFKYRFDDVWQMPIYAFMDAVKRIQVIEDYNNLMFGYYTGNIDLKKIKDKSKLNWMRPLE